MNTITYAIAIGQLIFAGIGFVTGWMSPNECLTVAMLGLSVFGIHKSNLALGRALGASRY